MALSNFENITVAKCLEHIKPELSQNYFQPGPGIAILNFGPGFRVWQRTYDSMILDLMDKAVNLADAGALALLTDNLGRAYIENTDGVAREFMVDGLPRVIGAGEIWCLHLTVINLIKQQAALLGYGIADATDVAYAVIGTGLVVTFGD